MEDEQNHQVTAPPSYEPNISTDHVWTDVIYVELKGDKKDQTVASYVSDMLLGCGNVALVKMQVTSVPMKDNSFFKMGFHDAGSNPSINQVALKPNGIFRTANAMTRGIRGMDEVQPEDTMSRQIRPISSMLPELKVMYEKDADTVVTMAFFLNVRGMRTRYVTLN